MGFYIDFSEFDRLQESLKDMQKDFDDFLKDFLIEMAQRIIAETKPKTPVDTGALKNAWRLGEIIGNGKEIAVVIENPMEYATDIEYGHRIVSGTGENKKEVGWYEGRFMLKTSIEHIQQQMPLRFKKKFEDFCNKHNLK